MVTLGDTTGEKMVHLGDINIRCTYTCRLNVCNAIATIGYMLLQKKLQCIKTS